MSTTSRVWLAGELGTFRGGSGFPIRHQGKKSGDLPFFKVSDMNSGGNELFMTRANNYISEAQRKTLGAVRMPAQAIVFAKVGAAVFQERKRILAQDSCIDNNMAAFIVDKGKLDVRFAHYLLTAFRMSDLVAVGALPSLNGRQLRSIPLLVPSDLAEQRRIVAALADADSLIATLERLIAKKQAIKQGMMQQLLTGRTRLPGFTDRWGSTRLGEHFEITSSKRVFQREWRSTGVPFYRARELAVLGETGAVDNDLFIDRTLFEKYKRLHGAPSAGDFLVTGVGTLGKTYVVGPADEFYFKDGNIIWFKRSDTVDSRFLKYLFETPEVQDQVHGESAGTTVGTYTITNAKRTRIPLAPIEEQRAIAIVLQDVDSEIAVIRSRLGKARAIKTGMMQQLLTGRTHLPVESAS